MDPNRYTVWLIDPDGSPASSKILNVETGEVKRRPFGLSTANFTAHVNSSLAGTGKDDEILVVRDGNFLYYGIVQTVNYAYGEDGSGKVEVNTSALAGVWGGQRIVEPPDGEQYQEYSGDEADDLIKDIWLDNIGSSAASERQISGFDVEADENAASTPTETWRLRYSALNQEVPPRARNYGVQYYIYVDPSNPEGQGGGTRYELRTQVQTDRSHDNGSVQPVIFDERIIRFPLDIETTGAGEKNLITVGGPGIGPAQAVTQVATSGNTTAGNRKDLHGSNTLTDNNTVPSVSGRVGRAADFTPGNSEYLSISDNASLSFVDENFTLAAWVYLDDKSVDRGIISKWNTTGDQREYKLFYDQSADRFVFRVSSDGTSGTATTVNADNLGSPSTSTWYYVVAYHDADNNQIGISVNGGEFNTASHSGGVYDGTSDFNVGAVNGANLMDGRIDTPALWSEVLSTDFVTTLTNPDSRLLETGDTRLLEDGSERLLEAGTTTGGGVSYADLGPRLKRHLISWWDLDEVEAPTGKDRKEGFLRAGESEDHDERVLFGNMILDRVGSTIRSVKFEFAQSENDSDVAFHPSTPGNGDFDLLDIVDFRFSDPDADLGDGLTVSAENMEVTEISYSFAERETVNIQLGWPEGFEERIQDEASESGSNRSGGSRSGSGGGSARTGGGGGGGGGGSSGSPPDAGSIDAGWWRYIRDANATDANEIAADLGDDTLIVTSTGSTISISLSDDPETVDLGVVASTLPYAVPSFSYSGTAAEGTANTVIRSDATIEAVRSLSADGGTDLFGDVNLVSGTDISLSRSGQDITIASTFTAGNAFTTINTTSGTSPVADSSTDTLNISAGSNISVTGDSSTDTVTIAATGVATNAFTTINTTSGTSPVADSTTDTLNISAGSDISVTGNSSTDTVTIAYTGHTSHSLSGSSGSSGSHTHTVGGNTGNESLHTHGSGTLATDTASSHTHGDGTLATDIVTGHTHGDGTLATDIVTGHTHFIDAIPLSVDSHSHSHTIDSTVVGDHGSHSHSEQEASHAHSGSACGTSDSGGGHSHSVTSGSTGSSGSHSHNVTSGSTGSSGSHSHNVTSGSTGSGSSHNHSFGDTSTSDGSHTHGVGTYTIS